MNGWPMLSFNSLLVVGLYYSLIHYQWLSDTTFRLITNGQLILLLDPLLIVVDIIFRSITYARLILFFNSLPILLNTKKAFIDAMLSYPIK